MSELSPLRCWGYYRDVDCPNCRRHRVQDDGVCEKCLWDVDNGDYAAVTRPNEYNSQGYIWHRESENTGLLLEYKDRPNYVSSDSHSQRDRD